MNLPWIDRCFNHPNWLARWHKVTETTQHHQRIKTTWKDMNICSSSFLEGFLHVFFHLPRGWLHDATTTHLWNILLQRGRQRLWWGRLRLGYSGTGGVGQALQDAKGLPKGLWKVVKIEVFAGSLMSCSYDFICMYIHYASILNLGWFLLGRGSSDVDVIST